ncbi:hypothetical protein AAW18_09515 [Xanthomonas campestris pv. campestris]|nr:hypothetical protein AEA01_10995 [Xanthomonas campestris pv. campestris]ALE68684.1 hypothetical protein AAW18_09515 [Xanthomonas campestris pv. campestris]
MGSADASAVPKEGIGEVGLVFRLEQGLKCPMRARIAVVHRARIVESVDTGVGIVLVTVPKRPVGTDCGGAPSSDAANLPLPLWKPYSLLGLSPLSWPVIRSAPSTVLKVAVPLTSSLSLSLRCY